MASGASSLQPPASGLLKIMNDGGTFKCPRCLPSKQLRLACKPWSSPASSLCGAVQLFRQRPTFASKFRKHNNGVLDIIRPQLVLDQAPLLKAFPVLALRSIPKHHSSDHHRVAGLGTHALDAARPKSSPDTWATGKTNAVSSYALNAPLQLFGASVRFRCCSARWRCTTDNAFSVPVGTLLGVERGDVETLASTVHAANLLRMWG
ncbi:hypothetical protein B0H14DRAFT_3449227 [Mycena olivaceomarginata]|nr:hypothetical protein B0H14DRAFT_3449227 [Mycena olivaceomarginata]